MDTIISSPSKPQVLVSPDQDSRSNQVSKGKRNAEDICGLRLCFINEPKNRVNTEFKCLFTFFLTLMHIQKPSEPSMILVWPLETHFWCRAIRVQDIKFILSKTCSVLAMLLLLMAQFCFLNDVFLPVFECVHKLHQMLGEEGRWGYLKETT